MIYNLLLLFDISHVHLKCSKSYIISLFSQIPHSRMWILKSVLLCLLVTFFGSTKCMEDMEVVMILGGASDSDVDTKEVELYKREEEDIKCGLLTDLCIPDLPEELHRATAIYEEDKKRVLVCGGGKIK